MSGREAEHQEEVPSDHVHHETKSQSYRAKNEGRKEFDRSNQGVEIHWHTGWEKRVREKLQTVLLDTGIDESHVSGSSQNQWKTNHGCA